MITYYSTNFFSSFSTPTRGCIEIKQLEKKFIDEPALAMTYFRNLLDHFIEFLRFPKYDTVTFILLWKVMSEIPRNGIVDENKKKINEIVIIAEFMGYFVRRYINVDQDDVGKYAIFKEELGKYAYKIR